MKVIIHPVRRWRNPYSGLIYILLFCFLLPSCQKKKISEENLVKIYVENLVLEESIKDNQDSLSLRKRELFSQYNVSEADYAAELSKYSDDPEEWKLFFSKALDYLEEMKKKGIIE